MAIFNSYVKLSLKIGKTNAAARKQQVRQEKEADKFGAGHRIPESCLKKVRASVRPDRLGLLGRALLPWTQSMASSPNGHCRFAPQHGTAMCSKSCSALYWLP